MGLSSFEDGPLVTAHFGAAAGHVILSRRVGSEVCESVHRLGVMKRSQRARPSEAWTREPS